MTKKKISEDLIVKIHEADLIQLVEDATGWDWGDSADWLEERGLLTT